jgi:hypothetical protein
MMLTITHGDTGLRFGTTYNNGYRIDKGHSINATLGIGSCCTRRGSARLAGMSATMSMSMHELYSTACAWFYVGLASEWKLLRAVLSLELRESVCKQ